MLDANSRFLAGFVKRERIENPVSRIEWMCEIQNSEFKTPNYSRPLAALIQLYPYDTPIEMKSPPTRVIAPRLAAIRSD